MFSEKSYFKYIQYLEKKIQCTYIIIIAISIFIGLVSGVITLLITVPLGNFIAKKITNKSNTIIKQFEYEIQKSKNEKCNNMHSTGLRQKESLYTENFKYEKSCSKQINYRKYYRPRIYITTLNELHFYEVLLEIAKELDLILFSQVCLYSIIETRKDLDYSTKTTFFNKISSKSIDFVLVDKRNCRIKLCIELDDSSHKQKKRVKRDEFIDEVFEQLEINLLRYPVYSVYYKETLKNKILENLKEPIYPK